MRQHLHNMLVLLLLPLSLVFAAPDDVYATVHSLHKRGVSLKAM